MNKKISGAAMRAVSGTTVGEVADATMDKGRPQGSRHASRQTPLRSPSSLLLWRTSILAILLLALLLAFPLTASAQTLPTVASSGRIYGQLRDGTKRNAPVAGQSVTLQGAQGGNTGDLETTTTDAHGMYSFGGLSTDKTISYAVYTLYQKAQYVSGLVDLSSRPQQQVDLTVYDATTSVAKIAIVQANILIDKADPQHGLLTITESFYFENLGLTTYVGSVAANGQKPNALLFSLPPGAQQVSLKAGFDGYQQAQVNNGFASTAAVPPGLSQFAFSFQVSYSATHYDFSYTVLYPIVSLSVLLPLDYHASSAALLPQGTVNTNGQVYQQLSAQQLLANARVHVELDGLPVTTTASGRPVLGLDLSWLIWIVLAMLAIVGITWYLATRARRSTGKTRTVRPPTRASSSRKAPVQAKATNGAKAAREKQAAPSEEEQTLQVSLLAELLALDKAYEAGTIKKAAYDERRSRLKARLRAVMSAEQDEQTANASGTKKASKSGAKKA
ncbi:MAG TPA: hypothetical protein VGT44_15950 [Ktedonobacteraceae bacterium]|nr:hypothetical protein [Ktedonobacteraceae bacterium]